MLWKWEKCILKDTPPRSTGVGRWRVIVRPTSLTGCFPPSTDDNFPKLYSRQAKCELAKMKNKETCYKTILEKRDSLIVELDEKLEQLTEKSSESKAGWGYPCLSSNSGNSELNISTKVSDKSTFLNLWINYVQNLCTCHLKTMTNQQIFSVVSLSISHFCPSLPNRLNKTVISEETRDWGNKFEFCRTRTDFSMRKSRNWLNYNKRSANDTKYRTSKYLY